jgi:hypothetical protein
MMPFILFKLLKWMVLFMRIKIKAGEITRCVDGWVSGWGERLLLKGDRTPYPSPKERRIETKVQCRK